MPESQSGQSVTELNVNWQSLQPHCLREHRDYQPLVTVPSTVDGVVDSSTAPCRDAHTGLLPRVRRSPVVLWSVGKVPTDDFFSRKSSDFWIRGARWLLWTPGQTFFSAATVSIEVPMFVLPWYDRESHLLHMTCYVSKFVSLCA